MIRRASVGRHLLAAPIHPLLAAAYPVVFLFAQNVADQVTLGPLWVPLASSIGAAVAGLVVFRLLLGDWFRAALITTLLAAVFFSFGHVWFVSGEFLGLRRYLVGAYLLVGLAGAWAVWRGGGWVVPLTRALNLLLAMLVLVNVYGIVSFTVDAPEAASVGTALQVSADGRDRPDVYYVILDRYANSWTLENLYDYDNREFLDELRARGFFVAEEAWANYFKTAFSLASSLDANALDADALRSGSREGQEFGPIHAMLRGHLAAPLTFKSLGYEYVHVGTYWPPSATNVDADVTFNYGDGLEFSTALGETTALSLLSPARPAATGRTTYTHDLIRQFHEFGFEKLKGAADRDGPTFTFAHFLLPHPPYVHLSDGRIPTPADERRSVAVQYTDQMEYTNLRVLEAIDTIRASPGGEEAVIIVQGDEGPFPAAFDDNERHFSWLDASREQVAEKFGILNAVSLPGADSGAVGLHSRSTPINTFRIVLNHLFDADLPLLPEVINLSPDYVQPYDFVPIERDASGMPILPGPEGTDQ